MSLRTSAEWSMHLLSHLFMVAVYITFVQITHQIKVLNKPLCRAQAIFMRCQTTSGVPNIVGLPTARSKTVRDSKGLPIARGKLVCEFDFHLTVSITIVRSIEKTQNTPNHPNLHQTITVYSQYHIMRDFLGHPRPLRGGGGGSYAPKPPPQLFCTSFQYGSRQYFWGFSPNQ